MSDSINEVVAQEAAPGDLSASSVPESSRANRSFELDSEAKRLHRRWATQIAIVVIVFLGVCISEALWAATSDLKHLTPSGVAIVAVLVVAVTVLTIALVRSTFAPDHDSPSDGEVLSPNLEVIKEIREAAKTVVEAVKVKG